METLRIVVPSRKRVPNMAKLSKLLPSALVCVDEAERSDYEAAVGAERVICHPGLQGIPRIRNWMNEKIQEDCIVQIDDDLQCIRPMIGKQRPVEDPEIILQVIRNEHRVCEDLGITTFCWSRSRNIAMMHPELLPFRLVHPLAGSFGLRGAARQRRFDDRCSREDMDFSLQCLLEDRIVLSDMRWYFDHGPVGQPGRNQDALEACRLLAFSSFRRTHPLQPREATGKVLLGSRVAAVGGNATPFFV
jgi:glycosyltransferase involved in cell wall biosynthesis